MDTDAFSRVRSLFRYARPAQWTAIVFGVATAILFALLVLLLALFADLLVTRGRIANFSGLPVREQEQVVRDWSSLNPEERARALHHIGFGDFENPPARTEPLSSADQVRWLVYRDLGGLENADPPPVGAAMTAEALRDWAARRRYTGDPYQLAISANELRWRAFVWSYLDRRVDPDAANRWQPAVDPKAADGAAGMAMENRRPFGILGLV